MCHALWYRLCVILLYDRAAGTTSLCVNQFLVPWFLKKIVVYLTVSRRLHIVVPLASQLSFFCSSVAEPMNHTHGKRRLVITWSSLNFVYFSPSEVYYCQLFQVSNTSLYSGINERHFALSGPMSIETCKLLASTLLFKEDTVLTCLSNSWVGASDMSKSRVQS